jgi:hypothetical protein
MQPAVCGFLLNNARYFYCCTQIQVIAAVWACMIQPNNGTDAESSSWLALFLKSNPRKKKSPERGTSELFRRRFLTWDRPLR